MVVVVIEWKDGQKGGQKDGKKDMQKDEQVKLDDVIMVESFYDEIFMVKSLW